MDIFKDQREKYFPKITSLEFEKKIAELEERLKCVNENISNINEQKLLLETRRNICYQRKAELLNQLYKLINSKNPEYG